MFNPTRWYWLVAADDTKLFSSDIGDYVAADDESYLAWVAAGHFPTRIASETELLEVLRQLAPDVVMLTPAGLIAYAADLRWRKETGGIVVAGVPVATDDRSKQMLMGARVAADADAAFSTQWSGADGVIYPLSAAQIIGISNAVLTHVARCFDTYSTVKTAIDAGTLTTKAQVDAAFV